MDAHNDGPYSRAPEIEDFLKICTELNKAGARYVLIGGFAIIINGFARATKDIDFLVDDSESNLKKIKQALSFLPDKASLLIEDGDVAQYKVVRIGDEVTIDLLGEACGIRYEEAIKNADFFEIEGVKIPVANKQTLIRTKDTIRPHDKVDRDYLQALIKEESKK
jgi:hypothetical protein